jgi:hypothetical protein
LARFYLHFSSDMMQRIVRISWQLRVFPSLDVRSVAHRIQSPDSKFVLALQLSNPTYHQDIELLGVGLVNSNWRVKPIKSAGTSATETSAIQTTTRKVSEFMLGPQQSKAIPLVLAEYSSEDPTLYAYSPFPVTTTHPDVGHVPHVGFALREKLLGRARIAHRSRTDKKSRNESNNTTDAHIHTHQLGRGKGPNNIDMIVVWVCGNRLGQLTLYSVPLIDTSRPPPLPKTSLSSILPLLLPPVPATPPSMLKEDPAVGLAGARLAGVGTSPLQCAWIVNTPSSIAPPTSSTANTATTSIAQSVTITHNFATGACVVPVNLCVWNCSAVSDMAVRFEALPPNLANSTPPSPLLGASSLRTGLLWLGPTRRHIDKLKTKSSTNIPLTAMFVKPGVYDLSQFTLTATLLHANSRQSMSHHAHPSGPHHLQGSAHLLIHIHAA